MTQEEKTYFVNTKLRWIELLEKGYTKTELALLAGRDRKTLGRWHKRYRDYGADGLAPRSKRPHSCPRQTKDETVELIKQLRFSRARPLGPIPISVKLKKHYGIVIHWQTAAKVLRREGLIVKKSRTRQKESLPRYSVSYAGEIVEIDVKYASKINDKWTYQYTATDCFTRMRCLETYPEQTNHIAVKFLALAVSRFPFQIKAVKTDNHSTFTNRYTGYAKSIDPLNPRIHIFDRVCQSRGIIHYLIDKGKPQQNGKVERSHRTDNEELYEVESFTSLDELRKKQKEWLRYYNYEREHQGINNLTPFEKYQQQVNISQVG